MEYIMMITTTDSLDLAEKITEELLKERSAACIQIIGPIRSRYIWQNKIEASDEYLIFIKTKKNLYKKVEEKIKSLHSYSVPEIIALPIMEGIESYLRWIDEVVRE